MPGMGGMPLSPMGSQMQYPAGAGFANGQEMNTFATGAKARPEKPGNTIMNTGADKSHFDPHDYHPETGKIQIDSATGQAPRRCTDLACCFVFMVYMLLCLTLVFNAHRHGNMGRLTHGVDYYGRVCGVDPGVENMPFLFWCRADPESTLTPTSLDLDRPSCVPYCPASNNMSVTIPCLLKNKHQSSQVPGAQFGNVKTLVFEMQESIVQTAPYATTPRGGRYCIPDPKVAPDLNALVLSDNRALGTFSTNRFLTVLGTLGHLWWLLAICCLTSCFLGYAFNYSIKTCPRSIVYPFTYPAVILFGLFGLGFTFAFLPLADPTWGISEWYIKQNPFFQRYAPVYAAIGSYIAAVVCWLLTFCFYNMTSNFDTLSNTVSTVDLLSVAHDCQGKIPFMRWIPVFEGIAKFTLFFCGLQGFRILASEGWIEKNRIHVNGAEFAGLSRSFKPSTQDVRFWIQAVIWLYGFRWAMEIVSCFAYLIIMWCVFQWWRVKKEKGKKGSAPSGTIFEGVKNALLYHMGSLVIGALLIPMWRPWHFLYWVTSELSPDKPSGGVIGKVFECICCCCKSCIGSVKVRAKEEIQDEAAATKDGFNDVAIRSNDYIAGVEKGHALLEHSHKIVQYLYRDLWNMTLHVIAVSTCSSFSAAAVYIVVCNLDIYKKPVSEYYIADPFLVTFLAFLLSSYIVSGFMNLWDHTSDCLLYCYCWHRRWSRATVDKYIPDSLRYIVGYDDAETDRYPYYGRAKNNMYLRFWMPMFGMESSAGKEGKPKVEGRF